MSEDCQRMMQRDYQSTSASQMQSYDEFWIGPNGKCWKIDSSLGHYGFAVWWFGKNGMKAEDICASGFYPTEELQKHGWIRVSSGVTVLNRKPTAAQADAVYDWMKKNGGEAYFGGSQVPEIRKYTTQEFLDTVASTSLSKRSIIARVID